MNPTRLPFGCVKNEAARLEVLMSGSLVSFLAPRLSYPPSLEGASSCPLQLLRESINSSRGGKEGFANVPLLTLPSTRRPLLQAKDLPCAFGLASAPVGTLHTNSPLTGHLCGQRRDLGLRVCARVACPVGASVAMPPPPLLLALPLQTRVSPLTWGVTDPRA